MKTQNKLLAQTLERLKERNFEADKWKKNFAQMIINEVTRK